MQEKSTRSHHFQFGIVRLLAALATALPTVWAHHLCCWFGDLSFLVLAKRRKIALENITRAFHDSIPEERKREIARAAFRSAALSMMELFTVEKTFKEAAARFKLFGNEYLEEAFGRGKGVVLVIAHLGSWEYLSFLPYFTKRRWSVIVKDIKNRVMNNAVNEMRRVMTVHPVSKDNSVRTILKELKHGNGMAILIDQWSGAEGLWTDFFGEKTSTTSIPARLAEKTGCALVPACCLRAKPGHYEIHIEEPIAYDLTDPDWERTITQALNDSLERQILKNPDQWLWGHRRWKDQPGNLRAA